MRNIQASNRGPSWLLLGAGALAVVAVACFTAIAVVAAWGSPFPGMPAEVNDSASLSAVVSAAVATLCIYAGLLVRR
jgi:hypothetical protein